MKIEMADDEYYPFTFIVADDANYRGEEVEVDDETVARWRRVMAEFDVAQAEMQAAYRAVASR